MSPIGRIFIVANLLLSAAFLGWAASSLAQTQDWKTKYETKSQELSDAEAQWQEEKAKLQEENDALANDSRSFRDQRDGLQAEVDRLKGEIADAQRVNENLRGDITKIQGTLGDFNSTIAQITTEKDRAVERANEAASAQAAAEEAAQTAEEARRNAEDQLAQARTQIGDLEVEKTQLANQVSDLETQVAMIVDLTDIDLASIAAQPLIEGAVLEVRLDLPPGLVMLNVGKAQGVKRGFTFDIYRGSQYKGRVRVQNVQENISSATIEQAVPSVTIQQGDRAATRL